MKRLPLSLSLMLAVAACNTDNGGKDDAPGDVSAETAEDASTRTSPVEGLDAASTSDAQTIDAGLDAAFVEQSEPNQGAPDASEPEAADASAPEATAQDAGAADANAASSDAGSSDAGSSDAGNAHECSDVGVSCKETACCEGAACVAPDDLAFPVCANLCEKDSDCQSGCCARAPNADTAVCAPAEYCEPDPSAPLTDVHCRGEQPKVFDSKDQYLGEATANMFERNGVCNIGGAYGQFMPGGALYYDSDSYSLSLASAATIKCAEDDINPIAYITKFKGDAPQRTIDPADLCDVLRNSKL